ncbi:MAG TPA: lyase family protein [Jatrophihabitantaceae bacterium]|jgi:argininosuccinate lyase
MSDADYLGLGSRLASGPSRLLVETGFHTESRQATYLHGGLGLADLAHVLALRDAGALPEPAGARLLAALVNLIEHRPDELAYDPADGDAYNSREHMLRVRVGTDAGWLSLGRTRREAGRVAFYLAARTALLQLHDAVAEFVEVALLRAVGNLETWWADLTYWQPAQVSTFGHYLLSFAHEAARHLDRIEAAWKRCGLVPVAAGGVAGTTVPVSRQAYLRRLGLHGAATTSRDAMWSVDGLLDVVFVADQTAITASRMAEDFMIFTSAPFGYVRLDDAHCRASVYLPQKRNPYALSVVRGGASVVAGRASGLVTSVRTASAQSDNWIYNYGEALETVELAGRMAALMGEVLAKADFDTARMADLAQDGFTDAADLAERLVAEGHLDYRSAHSLIATLTTAAEQRGDTRLSAADYATLAGQTGAAVPPADPRSLVLARAHDGGAAPSQVRASAARLRRQLTRRRAWREQVGAAADTAARLLVDEAVTASAARDLAADRPLRH